MKLDTAIRILKRCASDGIPRGETPFNDAIELGIEALKRIKDARDFGTMAAVNTLPGETTK